MKFAFRSILVAATLAIGVSAASAATLDDVKKNGAVRCGVSTGLLGFSAPDDAGEWTGFDIDYCRAIAAAIFNDPKAVKFTPLTAKDRFTTLMSRDIDVLVRNTTWTITRDTSQGMTFAGVNYYDGQGLMVKKSYGVGSALELSNATVCVQTGTTTELNLSDYFDPKGMQVRAKVSERLDDAIADYDAGRCDAFTADASALYGIRLSLTTPDDHLILPEIISKEPLGPAVRQDDVAWTNIVKWVHFALLDAEELGVTQANVEEMKTSDNQDIRRLLGVEGTFGEGLGLSNDWVVNIIRAVGNYGEIFDRNLGAGSKLQIARGLNALWTKGGLQYGMPVR
jgi:general L-amino acid transport system substrate-binding protein